MSTLRRDFATREALVAYIAQEFPEATGPVSPIRGGRQAALAQLAAIQPETYGDTRNYLDGTVTRLSPYLRHGVLALTEVRDWLQQRRYSWKTAEPLVRQLAWRAYWQTLYDQWGDGIWEDREPYKTGWQPEDYANDLPGDIPDASTGLLCIDSFSRELQDTGYLHNHVRLWLAAYVVHWRRVKWQAGARWFLEHLLDGDPASNNLSWQWVASTFSHKPYYFNQDNLARYSRRRWCEACPHDGRATCPFRGSYEQLARRLFPHADLHRLGTRR